VSKSWAAPTHGETGWFSKSIVSIGKFKSVAASRWAEAAAVAAFGESRRDSGHVLTARFDPILTRGQKNDAAQHSKRNRC
jgi:hypothetical protein